MNDFTEMKKKYLEQLIEEEQEELMKNEKEISGFKEIMRVKGINLNEDNFRYISKIGIVAAYPNLLSYLDAAFVKDKEGLLNFKSLLELFERKRFAIGHLYAKNFMVLAHPNFRRGFHPENHFAPRFIEFFWNCNFEQIDAFIALDFDRVRINITEYTVMELDTWHGASFDKDISEIKDGTVKMVPPQDIDEHYISSFFSNAYSFDVKWYTKGSIKVFQAEEFKTENIKIIKDGIEYFPVRYVHAEFDLESSTFRHFDGAIHYYTHDEYHNRRTSDFNYNEKSITKIKTKSEKLFKMNGIISVESWLSFTTHFFTGNPIVIEYFEGQYPLHIRGMLSVLRNKHR